MGQTPRKKADNAAVTAALSRETFIYDKVGARPRGRPIKRGFGAPKKFSNVQFIYVSK